MSGRALIGEGVSRKGAGATSTQPDQLFRNDEYDAEVSRGVGLGGVSIMRQVEGRLALHV